MIRFTAIEDLGVSVAAMSDKTDGDCAFGAPGREGFCRRCGVDARDVVCVRQVHGVRVLHATETHRGSGSRQAKQAVADTDAIVTGVPGLPIAISIADCVPVFLTDPVRRAVGLAHAGRRGAFDGICRATVESLAEAFGTQPRDVHALIGPSAGPERYEVSQEIADEWRGRGLPSAGRLLDLWEANAQQLRGLGVPESQIRVARTCTLSSGRFFSYRSGDGQARNMALMMI